MFLAKMNFDDRDFAFAKEMIHDYENACFLFFLFLLDNEDLV